MRNPIVIFSLLGMFFVSCGGEKTAQQQRDPQPAADKEQAKKTKQPPKVDSSDKKTLTGRLTLQDNPNPSDKLTLTALRDNRIEGAFQLSGTQFVTQGFVESDNVRLWVRGQNQSNDAGAGFIVGTAKDGNYDGTFSISGNGGEPILNGTWKTDGVF